MKVWKMLGCLALLSVIICGCAAMGSESVGGDKVEPPLFPMEDNGENPDPLHATTGKEEMDESATVEPLYSEGLLFRSNGDGTCSLAGMGSCTSSCLLIPPKSPAGDTVTEILPFALENSIIGAVELPTTVHLLSASSFHGCPRLAYIRVASGNTAFTEYDGALYNGDGSALLYCPAGRNGAELKLNTSIKRIAAGAFAECKGLRTVIFHGSTSEWHNVIVGDDNNPLYAAGFRFLK